MRTETASPWALDPKVDFLNHGSFGARLETIVAAQAELRDQMEREPITFFVREFEERLDRARREVAAFVGAEAEGFVFVPNVTNGVAAVLGSLAFREGDAILTTDHVYNACRNALVRVASRAGAEVTIARVPFPLRHEDEVIDAVISAVAPRTRLALIDHVTSPTGLVFPVAAIAQELERRGVPTLIDGAHGPGMLDLDVRAIGASYYTGNLHKWTCAPVGAAFLAVREDRRASILPAITSHGANSARRDRPQIWNEFDWSGTIDYAPYLIAPFAITEVALLRDSGWPEIRRECRARVLKGRDRIAGALEVDPPAPDSMIGTLASIPIPDGRGPAPTSALYMDPLQQTLFDRHRIEVPIVPWPAWPKRLIRISAHLYNTDAQYERLARALSSVVLPAVL